MIPDRSHDVERICQAALELRPAERSAFVADACRADEELRREVESLLAQDTAADQFIETPALEMVAKHLQQIVTIGSRLGPYEISSHLGTGGMGEVYRAHDTRLQREVALKVLPAAFALDPDRLARFRHEAQVLASLSHPNIAIIHDVEEADGVPALVLELVEGPTLAERIAQGPIPLEEALAIARQVAEALEAAHDKGIIHRDLKPANVKVPRDGAVKVLDFGLAKVLEPPLASCAPSSPPSPASRPGMLLGTAAYMSPEQAREQHVDRRTDVWAFGCVLFEMLTGRAVFEGETTVEILAAVVKADPDWGRLPVSTPEAIQRLLRRCLQKDVRLRLHDIADARLEIEEAAREPPLEGRAAGNGGWERKPAAWALATVAVVAALTAMLSRIDESKPPSPEMRVEIATASTTDPISLQVSPDGRQVVFVATFEGRPRLWLRRLDDLAAWALTGTDFAAHPFWSPDGRSLAFFADQRLKRLDLDGGAVQPLARVGVGLGGTWTRDGQILFSARPASPILRVSDVGGEVAPVTRVQPGQVGHRFPQVLPDGSHFIYYSAGTPETAGIYVARMDGSDARRLVPTDSAGVFASSGHLLFIKQGTLHALRFDPAGLAVVGSPFSVAENVAVDSGFGRPALSAAKTGPILYRQAGGGGRQQFIWFDRLGQELARLGEPDSLSLAHPSMSPDGRRVAMTRAAGGNSDLWLIDAARGALSRLTSDGGGDIFPVWSPDGRRIVFGSNRRGRGGLELYQKSTTSSDGEELLAPMRPGMRMAIPDDWSPDGRFILFRDNSASGGYDLWVLPLDPAGEPVPVVRTEFEEGSAQFSPDGRWIAYQSDESGRAEVYVQPFPGPGARTQLSTAGGAQVRWNPRGNELFYVALDGLLMAVPIRLASDGVTLDADAPVPLFATRILAGLPGQGNHRQQYVVAPDGRRFLVHSVVREDTSPIIVILNWKPQASS